MSAREGEPGDLGENPGVERDFAHDRIAFRDLPQGSTIGLHLGQERGELPGRQKVLADDKTVPVECFPVVLRNQFSELAAAGGRQPVGKSDRPA